MELDKPNQSIQAWIARNGIGSLFVVCFFLLFRIGHDRWSLSKSEAQAFVQTDLRIETLRS